MDTPFPKGLGQDFIHLPPQRPRLATAGYVTPKQGDAPRITPALPVLPGLFCYHNCPGAAGSRRMPGFTSERMCIAFRACLGSY